MDCSVNAQKFREWGEEENAQFYRNYFKKVTEENEAKFTISSKRKKKTAVTNIAGLFVKTGHTVPRWHIPCAHICDEIIKDG